MMEKIRRAWTIALMCWNVLKLDKELLVFPLLSILTCGLLAAGTFAPFWMSGEFAAFFELIASAEGDPFQVKTLAIGFAIYFVVAFVVIFFNSALVACAKIRFAGGDPTVADGLRASFSRLPQILVWALTTSAVGFFLSKMSEGKGGIAKFVLGLLGAGWAIASFFVIPVLVAEKVGPVTALKKSVSVIRKTWGELVVAELGFSVLSVFIVVPAFLSAFAAMILFEFSPVASISIVVLAVLWVFLTSLVFTTLSTILKTALYLYATEGKISHHFEPEMIKNPFEKRAS